MKKITHILATFAILFSFFLIGFGGTAQAQEQTQPGDLGGNVYFFWGEGCPHCAKEKPFLQSLQEKYEGVNVYDFEVWNSAENRELMIKVGSELNANVSGVPFTVVGNQYVVGYLNDETTGKQIEGMLQNCMECVDVTGNILAGEVAVNEAPVSETETVTETKTSETVNETPASETALVDEEELASVDIHFFYSTGCPLCTKEKEFLSFLSADDDTLNVNYYNVSKEKESRELYEKSLNEFNIDSSTFPFTVIGGQYIIGWDSFETTGNSVREAITCVKENHCEDKLKHLLVSSISVSDYNNGQSKIPETLTLPVFGEIQTKNISLPLLTFIIAALDGFNPCAMWTLVFLISVLLGMKDRRRMWILGSTFIVASAAVYFLFLAAWLNLLLFLGFVFWVRFVIGLVAIGGGGYYLKEFFTAEDTTCKVTGTEKRQKVFEKIKKITHESHFWLSFIGIIILAFAVNLVELICSAGLPAVYTQILTLSNLEPWQYYLYLVFYIFIFMLDDLVVFFIAMITLEVSGLSTKYSRASHIIGGVLMLIIGILLIFKPELLMFG